MSIHKNKTQGEKKMNSKLVTKAGEDFNEVTQNVGGDEEEYNPFSWDLIPRNKGEEVLSVGSEAVDGGYIRIATFRLPDGREETREIPDYTNEQKAYIVEAVLSSGIMPPKKEKTPAKTGWGILDFFLK